MAVDTTEIKKNSDWYYANLDSLLPKYDGKFIGISGCRNFVGTRPFRINGDTPCASSDQRLRNLHPLHLIPLLAFLTFMHLLYHTNI